MLEISLSISLSLLNAVPSLFCSQLQEALDYSLSELSIFELWEAFVEAAEGLEEQAGDDVTASAALRHPMRIRILEVVNERDMSPVQFMHLGLAPAVDKSQRSLSQISYLISRTMYQGLAARTEGAMLARTFDARSNRHLTWIAMEVDEQGWTNLMGALEGTLDTVEGIRREARDRLAGSGKTTIPVTIGMLGFESPPPAPLP